MMSVRKINLLVKKTIKSIRGWNTYQLEFEIELPEYPIEVQEVVADYHRKMEDSINKMIMDREEEDD